MASTSLSVSSPSTGLLPIYDRSIRGEAPSWSSHDRCAMIQPAAPASHMVEFSSPSTRMTTACLVANMDAQLAPGQAQQ